VKLRRLKPHCTTNDLKTAKAQGLRTAFVARPTEHGAGQTSDLAQDQSCGDLAPKDFVELAKELGC
jgi:2-haloacid dehalogenase